MGEKEINLDIRRLCIYLEVHKRLNLKVGKDRRMVKKDFNRILGEVFHIPKIEKPIVFKEMVYMKMIKALGNRSENFLIVLPLFEDPEKNAKKFYKALRIY